MNEKNFSLASGIIPTTYVNQGRDAIRRREHQVTDLLSHKKLPEHGWDDQSIELLLNDLSLMDSNNFLGNSGVGEREGRIGCNLVGVEGDVEWKVAQRHYHLSHGIGRAGDVAAIQPKAAGSSLICELTRKMSIDYIRTCGITQVSDGIVLPLATGMSLSLCLLSLRQERPDAKYVVWFRVDQKTCLKSILTSGLTPLILPPIMEGDELITDLGALTDLLSSTSASEILCILPTTSVFAPRLPDDIVAISRIAKRYDIPVVVNNAYGLQSRDICNSIDRAIRSGRVDLIVSSTDKNLMVPVGGAFVYGPRGDRIELIRKNYPGRASMSPILDVFITLLHFGKQGILELLNKREECVDYMREQLGSLAQKYGQRLLDVKHNPISMAVTLDSPHPDDPSFEYTDKDVTRFGAMLYTRGVSGARCVGHRTPKKVGPYEFANYGSHNDTYPHAYFTAAAAIGISRSDVDSFMERLDKNWKQYLKELEKHHS